MRKSAFLGVVVLVAAVAVLAQASDQTAAKKSEAKKTDAKEIVAKETVIDVEELDCEACATVIEVSLKEIADVAEVKMDIDNQTVTVTPKAQKTLSARALWKAVEESGFTPTKLVGPSGTFTKTPPS
jgi:mercuric ion binding protein